MNNAHNRRHLVRLINAFAFVAATIASVVLPGLYFLEDYIGEKSELQTLAAKHASVITRAVIEEPDIWPSQQQVLISTMAIAMHGDNDQDATGYTMFDAGRHIVATSIKSPLAWPIISQEALIYDVDRPIGFYKLERSLHDLMVESLFVLLAGVLLALIIVFPLRSVPLRALQKAFDDLMQEKEKALITLQSIGDAVITTDADMLIEYLNPIAENLTGWTTAEAKGLHMDEVFKIFNEITREPAVNPISDCLAKNVIVEMENHTILIRRTDKEEFHIEDSAAPIRRPDGSIMGAVMVFHDVTDRKVAQNHLRHIAFHDDLTALPNRALFQRKLELAMHDAQLHFRHVGVLFMDLDRFKLINDSLGHGIGDELLIHVAKRLESCVRDGDTVSRMGGDEFTAVLKDLKSPENAEIVAQKIIRAFTEPFNVQGHELHVTTSIGITIYPRDGENIEMLLKNADTAMYHAKSKGRNTFQYYAAPMNSKAIEILQIKNALHSALVNNEYFLEYQPKLDLRTNQIVGAEALLRWQNPKLGRVMPLDFISRLEDSGEIVKVGAWALRTAIAQSKRWMDAGYPMIVSVNVSVRQFAQSDLVDQVESMLKEAELPAHLLQIEITESILISDADRSASIIDKLRALGVGLALDDFGTGYSSLSYLRRFPISDLKIDMSFILDVGKNATADKVVKTIIELGQALNMRVIAEGVETEEQREHLLIMGCDAIQGYLLSRPLSVDAFGQLIDAHDSAPLFCSIVNTNGFDECCSQSVR